MIYLTTKESSPRLEYVLEFIFSHVWQEEIKFLKSNEIEKTFHPCIFYGFPAVTENNNLKINIPSSGILYEKGVRTQEIKVVKDSITGLPYFFETDNKEDYDFPFDLFALIFYLLSRYEEYLPAEKDQYGRYISTNSISVKNEFVQTPIIDQWLSVFKQKIENITGKPIGVKQKFSLFPTIDIDIVWAYANKGLSMWKGILKDIVLAKFTAISFRYKSYINPDSDPFFTFDYLENKLHNCRNNTIWFILYSKNPDSKDVNHNRSLTSFDDWLKKFTVKKSVGIHPSFQSHSSLSTLMEEKNSLEASIHQKLEKSRQHYILFSMPETYKNLIKAGIKEDYSMGFPEQIGYRAGTGFSFFWYDLHTEEQTELMVHPFQIMDVTMKKYKNWTPEQAITEIKNIMVTARKASSPVRFIWHNSSFYSGNGWNNWEKVFETIITEGNKQM
ncbi:MAG: polysaccharide deacetylase family protein [Saprospiraceae bacterium]|nr:polysaccharide deacetylase family protein [Saprospiraceae bacterium]